MNPKEVWDKMFPPQVGDEVEFSFRSGRIKKHVRTKGIVKGIRGNYPRMTLDIKITHVRRVDFPNDVLYAEFVTAYTMVKYDPRRVKITRRKQEIERQKDMESYLSS